MLYNEAKSSKSDLVYSNSILHHVEKYKYENMFAKHFARFFLKQGIMPFVQPSAIFSKNAYFKAYFSKKSGDIIYRIIDINEYRNKWNS
mgnify:CR=1 FL=1